MPSCAPSLSSCPSTRRLVEGDFNVRHGVAAAVYTTAKRWVAGLPGLLIFLFVIYPEASVCPGRLPIKLNPKYRTPSSKRSLPFLLLLIPPCLHISTRCPPSQRLTLQTVPGSPHPICISDANYKLGSSEIGFWIFTPWTQQTLLLCVFSKHLNFCMWNNSTFKASLYVNMGRSWCVHRLVWEGSWWKHLILNRLLEERFVSMYSSSDRHGYTNKLRQVKTIIVSRRQGHKEGRCSRDAHRHLLLTVGNNGAALATRHYL